MNLTLNGIAYTFIPIKVFRATHNLPPEFGVAQFELKDYSGLGRIDTAGTALNSVRAAVLEALPMHQSAVQWLTFLPQLTDLFADQLQTINEQVGLKQVEIEYAVAGFSDSLQAYAYALLQANSAKVAPPPFHMVYGDWLNSTARVYAQEHTFFLNNEVVNVQIVTHAYGRVGLLIQTPSTSYAVYDPALACPAEGFMTVLLIEVAERMVS